MEIEEMMDALPHFREEIDDYENPAMEINEDDVVPRVDGYKPIVFRNGDVWTCCWILTDNYESDREYYSNRDKDDVDIHATFNAKTTLFFEDRYLSNAVQQAYEWAEDKELVY